AFDTIYLYGGNYANGGLGFFSASVPGSAQTASSAVTRLPVNIYGDVDWKVQNRLFLEGSEIVAQTPGASVSISADYVMLTSGVIPVSQGLGITINEFAQPLAPPSGDSRALTIKGQTIDIQSAVLSGFSDVTFNSAGDIRLMVPPVNDFHPRNGTDP